RAGARGAGTDCGGAGGRRRSCAKLGLRVGCRPGTAHARASRVARVSLPAEHGAYLTLTGGAPAPAVVAPAPLAALGAPGAVGMAFLARGPIERRARGAALREWDGPALAVMAAVAVAGAFVAGVPVLLLAAAAVPLAAVAAKRSRRMRSEGFEIAAL